MLYLRMSGEDAEPLKHSNTAGGENSTAVSFFSFFFNVYFFISIMIIFSFLTIIRIFFSFIFISWRLITLQYCSGLCHTLT